MNLNDVKEIENLKKDLMITNSTNKKKEILKNYDTENVKKFLNYVYDNNKQTYMNVKSAEKCLTKIIEPKIYDDFYKLLDDLINREVTGHKAISSVQLFLKNYPDYKGIFYDVLNKDIKCKVGAKLINDVFPELIPTFEVALAYDISKANPDFNNDIWFASQKCDGVRCLTIIDENGKIKCYSREGHEFLTLQIVKDEIKKLNIKNVVFDGEIMAMDGNIENFQKIMKQIRKKDYQITENVIYGLFDMIPLKDFEKAYSNILTKERFENLSRLILGSYEFKILKVLTQIKINSEKDVDNLMDVAREHEWEGLILRKDSPYEGKRTKNLLKLKDFQDAEFEVLDILEGEIDDGNGHKVMGMTSVIIEHKKNKVKVGSGFSFEQRIEFYKNPEKIIGKIITVKYFKETINEDGNLSLRFPILKFIHGDKREF